MKVKARAGVRVPREDNPRRYIEEEPVEVPESAYYLRRLSDNDLVNVAGAPETAAVVANETATLAVSDETVTAVTGVSPAKGTK
ncbi:hypothetical protein C2U55_16845 [Enterobacteriaceae bacterium ENNIH3]|nr:hypothetical protein C2U55_16845 [Enterobacteriaceae bacterium ENNIH3]AUV10426.1 hypothetical protein C2U52_04180 [Enterobacteriaceae bacterium ENNIH2]